MRKKRDTILIAVLGGLVCVFVAAVVILGMRSPRIQVKSVFLSPSTQDKNLYFDGVTTERMNMTAISDLVAGFLAEADCVVYRSAPGSTLEEAVALSNELGAAIHVALHSNASGVEGATVRGCEVFCRPWDLPSRTLARCAYDSVSALTPTADRGIKTVDSLYELNNVKSTAILIEADFHDNAAGAAWLKENREAVARAVADGILAYFDNPGGLRTVWEAIFG